MDIAYWKRVSYQNYKASIELKGSSQSTRSRSEMNKAAHRQLFLQNPQVVLCDIKTVVFEADHIYFQIEQRLKAMEGSNTIPINMDHIMGTDTENNYITSSDIADQLHGNDDNVLQHSENESFESCPVETSLVSEDFMGFPINSDHNQKNHPEELQCISNTKSNITDNKSNENQPNCLALSRQKRNHPTITYTESSFIQRYLFYDNDFTQQKKKSNCKRRRKDLKSKQMKETTTVSVACQTSDTESSRPEGNLDVAILKNKTINKSNRYLSENKNCVSATFGRVEKLPDSNEKSDVEINMHRNVNECCFKTSVDLTKISLTKLLKKLNKNNQPETIQKVNCGFTDHKPKKKKRNKKCKNKEKSEIAKYVEYFANNCEQTPDNAVTSCVNPEGSNNIISTTSENNLNENMYTNETDNTYLNHNDKVQWVITTEPANVSQNNNVNNYNLTRGSYDCIQLDDDIVIPMDIENNALKLVNYIENDEQTTNLNSAFDSSSSKNQHQFFRDKNECNNEIMLPREILKLKRITPGNLNFDNGSSKISNLRPVHSSYSAALGFNEAIDLSLRSSRQHAEVTPQTIDDEILDLSRKAVSNYTSQSTEIPIPTLFSRNNTTTQKVETLSGKSESRIDNLKKFPDKENRKITLAEYSARRINNGTNKIEILNVQQICKGKKQDDFIKEIQVESSYDHKLSYEGNKNDIENGVTSQRLAKEKNQTEVSKGSGAKKSSSENVKSTAETKDSPTENINSVCSSELSFDYNVFADSHGICTPTDKKNEHDLRAFEDMMRDDDIISLHPDAQSLLGSPWYINDDQPHKELKTTHQLEKCTDDTMLPPTSHTNSLSSINRNAVTITFNGDQYEQRDEHSFTSTSTNQMCPWEIKKFKIPKKMDIPLNIQRKITNTNFIPSTEMPQMEEMAQLMQVMNNNNYNCPNLQSANVGSDMLCRNENFITFGHPCLRYLNENCQRNNCNYNHQLPDPKVINEKICNMSYNKLCNAYKFVRQHHKAFALYFSIFCEIFAKNVFRNKVIGMINDCELYNDCYHYLRIVKTCLIRTGLKTEEALRIILKRCNNKSFDMMTLLVDMILEVNVLAFRTTLEEFSNHKNFQFNIKAVNHMAKICNESKNVDLTQLVLKIVLSIPKEKIHVCDEIVNFLFGVSKLRLNNTKNLTSFGDSTQPNIQSGSALTLGMEAENHTSINHNNQIQYMSLSSTRNF